MAASWTPHLAARIVVLAFAATMLEIVAVSQISIFGFSASLRRTCGSSIGRVNDSTFNSEENLTPHPARVHPGTSCARSTRGAPAAIISS